MAEKPVGPTPRTRIRGGLAASAPSSRRVSSMSYTATPNQAKKVSDPKVVKTTRTTPAKKRQQLDQAQKQIEELAALQEQLSGLQGKLLEKDEALRSAENLIGRISVANAAVDELRGQLSDKESLIESTGSELHGAKFFVRWIFVEPRADDAETLERTDGRGDLACEVVTVDDELLEGGEVADARRDLAEQQVLAEEELAQGRQVTELRRDGAVQGVGAEVEHLEELCYMIR